MIDSFDVIVIGGGPAGSSAALILGRSRLKVLLIDKATPRNIRTHGIHGYLTRHAMSPIEFRRSAHKEILSVGVEIIYGEASKVESKNAGFTVELCDGSRKLNALRIVVATGLKDQMPDVEGMDSFYGTSVFHCPFCDGWEMRDKALGVYAKGGKGVAIARGLLTWSADVRLFTDGVPLKKEDRMLVAEAEILVHTEKIIRMTGRKGQLENIELAGGEVIARDAVFFDPQPCQQCSIPGDLGCTLTKSGAIRTDKRQRTEIPGLYVVGDAAADPNMVAIATADGVKAALNIVQDLQ
nr:NAD(P)/FAD-dependent oxidoreductase [Bacteroidota bacterium]